MEKDPQNDAKFRPKYYFIYLHFYGKNNYFSHSKLLFMAALRSENTQLKSSIKHTPQKIFAKISKIYKANSVS